MNPRDEWASLHKLATDAARDLPIEDLIAGMVEAAINHVEGAHDASVTIVGDEGISTVGEQSPLAVAIDRIQHEEGEGPCLTAAIGWRTYVIDDILGEDRWPTFCRRVAAETGMRSLLAYAIPGESTPRAALNFYATNPLAFDREAERVGALFAAQIAVALALEDKRRETESRVHHLEQAIVSRDLIGQAKGILMEREGCTADEAFEMLRHASQHLNQKVRDIAVALVEETQHHGRAATS